MEVLLPVLGGLSLFLYGMTIMGTGLQKAAGSKLKNLIGVLTNNRLMGVLVGALVTMIVQSSSATTVMVIGFVNAGVMTLSQAVGVIMGANIGTTITAQLIALNLTDYAPVALALGVAIWLAVDKKKIKNIGEILIGFGILFIGMDMMGNGLGPLIHNDVFSNIMVKLESPLLAALVGLGLTTLVQSSSASIGLLQALASQGLISIGIAFPVLFGENIGTTTTALISSIGANKTAKRAAIIHFLFNFIGTVLFMTLLRRPVELLVTRISPGNVSQQIANAHTLFNLINVIVLFPFANILVKIAEKIVPGKDVQESESLYLDVRIIETPAIALGQVGKEVDRMGKFVANNLERSRKAFVDRKDEEIEIVFDQEKKINKLEKEITDYLIQLSNAPLTVEEHNRISTLMYCVNDIERVGDHAENLAELAEERIVSDLMFTNLAMEELDGMFIKVEEGFDSAIDAFREEDFERARKVLDIEDEVNKLEKEYRKNHIERLNAGQCMTSSGVLFLDAISNLERVSDHSYNIAQYVLDGER